MAKRIRVSTDNATWYTLPGASGELSVEMANVDDTIFGQDYGSESPSIGMWTVTGAAFFKGVAGYLAAVETGGTPTSTTGEACTLVSGQTYQITAANKRIIDLGHAVTVKDNAVDHTADVESIDYLNGLITFKAAYTIVSPVTVDFYYVPTAAIGKARSFNLQQQLSEIDTTDYATAQANDGWRTYIAGLKKVSLELGNVWDAANDFIATLQSRDMVYINISPDDTAGDATLQVLARGMFKYLKQDQKGNVGALEDETLSLNLYVPSSELVATPFGWYFGSAPNLSMAVQIALQAWLDGTAIYVEYSPDGTNGKTGSCIVTDASIQNSYDGQNEFSFSFKGTGTLSDI